jgi:hypothetical protein
LPQSRLTGPAFQSWPFSDSVQYVIQKRDNHYELKRAALGFAASAVVLMLILCAVLVWQAASVRAQAE